MLDQYIINHYYFQKKRLIRKYRPAGLRARKIQIQPKYNNSKIIPCKIRELPLRHGDSERWKHNIPILVPGLREQAPLSNGNTPQIFSPGHQIYDKLSG